MVSSIPVVVSLFGEYIHTTYTQYYRISQPLDVMKKFALKGDIYHQSRDK